MFLYKIVKAVGIRKIGILGVIKTIYFNLRYFPFRDGIYMPVVLTSNVEIKNMYKNGIIFENAGGG